MLKIIVTSYVKSLISTVLRFIESDVMLRFILVQTDIPTRGELSFTQGHESLVALLGQVSGDRSLMPNTSMVKDHYQKQLIHKLFKIEETHLTVVFPLPSREAEILPRS